MLVEEESIQIQEQESKSFENLMFSKPGSSYLKLMQYYHDEKQLNSQTSSLKTWEVFIENHFSTTVEMEVNIFENQKLFYRIDANYSNLGYIYYHKNRSIFNNCIFINDHEESMERDEYGNELKVIKIKNGLNVLDYQKNKLFIHLDAIAKFNSEFKFQFVSVKIDKIQIFDEVNLKSLDLFELKNHIFSLFSKFKNFMEDLTNLISDLNFLDRFIGGDK